MIRTGRGTESPALWTAVFVGIALVVIGVAVSALAGAQARAVCWVVIISGGTAGTVAGVKIAIHRARND